MKIYYEKTIVDRVDEAINNSRRWYKKIEKIELDRNEYEQFKHITLNTYDYRDYVLNPYAASVDVYPTLNYRGIKIVMGGCAKSVLWDRY